MEEKLSNGSQGLDNLSSAQGKKSFSSQEKNNVGLDYSKSVGDFACDTNRLVLKLSKSLKRKLVDKSKREGISIEDFASELLAEGLVLRAWEIIERKITLNQPEVSYSQKSQNKNNYSSRQKTYGDSSFKSSGSRSGGSYGNNQRKHKYSKIMDDNANFIEYVRNQEKKK